MKQFVIKAFQLPKNEEILTCLALGYPAEGAGPLAVHTALYDDRAGVIPYNKMEEFFKTNLK